MNNKHNEKLDAVHNDILRELGATSEFDNVSTADLSAEQKRLDVELKKLELEERLENQTKRRAKKASQKQEFEAKTRAIALELARREAVQRGCTHRKGGIGVDAILKGQGDADVYAFLKHQLPSGDWMVVCQRCGGEWYPEDRFTGRPATVIGGFTYRDALQARTDNSPSKSTVFKFTDTRTPEQVASEAWQPPRNEKGELIKDTRALPLHGDLLEPSSPVRTR